LSAGNQAGPSSFVEEIVEFEPSRRLAYKIIEILQRSFERVLHWIKAELERTTAHKTTAGGRPAQPAA
jgi:hypothetical protein